MKTTFIGLREFRERLSELSNHAHRESEAFVVMKNNSPVFLVHTVAPESLEVSVLRKEVQEAKHDIDNGDFLTHDEMLQNLQLE